MKKILFAMFSMLTVQAMGQGKILYSVEWMTPKAGKADLMESKWKAHLAKFHGKDNAREVLEVMSGKHTGQYLLVEGPLSYADLDMERANAKAHTDDYTTNVLPTQEDVDPGTFYYRLADTLSYNGKSDAEKMVTTVYHLKSGKLNDLTAEIKRAVNVNTIIKSPASYNTYIQIWGGSAPEVVVVTHLKDGFRQLDNSIMMPMNAAFKDAYIKEYGQEMWDRRLKLLPEITDSYETYISKYRKDMSTKMN